MVDQSPHPLCGRNALVRPTVHRSADDSCCRTSARRGDVMIRARRALGGRGNANLLAVRGFLAASGERRHWINEMKRNFGPKPKLSGAARRKLAKRKLAKLLPKPDADLIPRIKVGRLDTVDEWRKEIGCVWSCHANGHVAHRRRHEADIRS